MKRSLLNSLRKGGFILYTRHAEATVGDDHPYLSFENCNTQRNLSELGRRQAVYYGEMLRNWQIPISYPIDTSPFCRTIETAQLAFGSANVQINPFWAEVYKLNRKISIVEEKKILEKLNSVLESQPPQGSNKAIIAHNFSREIGLGKIPNMGTVIIRPRGQDRGYEIIDKLSLVDFYNLFR